jgi:hypothetical protein
MNGRTQPSAAGERTSPPSPTAARGATDPAATSPRLPSTAAECCDRCGSVRLIRVKACWRCEACGYKSDCNGW